MATNNQFSIAVHLMAGLGYNSGMDITSSQLAKSVNTSASFVRRILAKLSKAGLVYTTTGKAGACSLAISPSKISLLDIYRTIDPPRVFSIHSYRAQKACPVSCNIKSALEKVLDQTQASMENRLSKISLAQVIADIKKA